MEQTMAMRLLAAGVPLTLLMDLSRPSGPDSAQILRAEGGDARWLLRGNPNGPSPGPPGGPKPQT